MEVLGKIDEKKGSVFEAGSKRIFIDLILLRGLVKRNISIIGLMRPFVAGQAWRRAGIVELNFSEIVGRGKKNSSVKKETVEVLAHEVRHILQPGEGRIDKLALFLMRFSFLLPLFILTFLGVIGGGIFSFLGFEQWIPWAFWGLAAVAWSLVGGIVLLYYFSPNERDARKFASEAVKDSRWLEIVQIEDLKR